ncbi:hypothetical protein [Corynebacterium massiliense]|uniref:hypothetical protein n=1 Tax=Corynebacterium massiliense TaxID=441501 RepID=UPI003C6C3B4F
MPYSLLGPADIRELAAELDVTPTKKWGQNFLPTVFFDVASRWGRYDAGWQPSWCLPF